MGIDDLKIQAFNDVIRLFKGPEHFQSTGKDHKE
tara:strand:+ start:577 stop:678 length:102 start_codon:yes stop_codon:yes gene_type:complete